MTTAQSVSYLKVLMTGRIRDLGRKYESGSQKRKRKDERDTKSEKVESKCKKISQFFPNVNKQVGALIPLPTHNYPRTIFGHKNYNFFSGTN